VNVLKFQRRGFFIPLLDLFLSTLHFVICYICQNGFMLPLSRVSLLFVSPGSFATLRHLAFAFLWQHFQGPGPQLFPHLESCEPKILLLLHPQPRVWTFISHFFFPRVLGNEDEEASTVIWQIYCSHNIAYNTSISGPATPTHTVRPQPTIYT